MNREVHVRFWESPEVKVLRATQHGRPIGLGDRHVRSYLNCGCAKTRVATPASGQ